MKIFLLFLIGLCSISAFGQKSASSDVTIYHDSQFGFSISYPKSWVPEEKSDGDMKLNVAADSTTEFAAVNLSVKKFTGTGSYAPADYVSLMLDKNFDLLKRTAENSLANGKLVSSGRISFGGQTAYFLNVEGSAGSDDATIDLKTFSVQLLSGGNIYTLTCGADIESYEKYLPQFRAIAASFKFDPARKK